MQHQLQNFTCSSLLLDTEEGPEDEREWFVVPPRFCKASQLQFKFVLESLIWKCLRCLKGLVPRTAVVILSWEREREKNPAELTSISSSYLPGRITKKGTKRSSADCTINWGNWVHGDAETVELLYPKDTYVKELMWIWGLHCCRYSTIPAVFLYNFQSDCNKRLTFPNISALSA